MKPARSPKCEEAKAQRDALHQSRTTKVIQRRAGYKTSNQNEAVPPSCPLPCVGGVAQLRGLERRTPSSMFTLKLDVESCAISLQQLRPAALVLPQSSCSCHRPDPTAQQCRGGRGSSFSEFDDDGSRSRSTLIILKAVAFRKGKMRSSCDVS
jgi:hypothetical protein